MPLWTLLTVLAIGAPATAQCFFVPDDTPSEGRCNWVPFGKDVGNAESGNQRYQTILTRADLDDRAGWISSLAFAPCPGGTGSATGTYTMDSIVITMDYVPEGSSLSTTFDDNLSGSAVVLLNTQNFVWHVTADRWNNIDLERGFDYDPQQGDLVVEILVSGTGMQPGGGLGVGMHRHAGRQRVFDFGYNGTPPTTARFDDGYALKMRVCMTVPRTAVLGVGCPASRPFTLGYSGSSQIGGMLYVDLSQGPASGPAMVSVGVIGVGGLPLDLTAGGMSGCWLYVVDLATYFPQLNGGSAQVQIPIPNNPWFVGKELFTQAMAIDPAANPVGISASNYGRITFW